MEILKAEPITVAEAVVLQPVVGGYLVVTKWGAEAYLPEFINAAQN